MRTQVPHQLCILVLGAFLSGCMTSGRTAPAAAEVTFDRYEIVTGSSERQTILAGVLSR